MIKTKKKWLAMMMAVVMMVGSLGVGFSVASTSDLFSNLKTRYIAPLFPDKANYASKLYVVLGGLNTNEIVLKTSITSAFNTAYNNDPNYFDDLGFKTPEDVIKVYTGLKSQLPATKEDLFSSSSTNIFSKMYRDTLDGITYIKYEEDYKAMTANLLTYFPVLFNEIFEEMAPTAEAKNEIMLTMINAFGTTKLGSAQRAATTGTYTLDLNISAINTTVKTKIIDDVNALNLGEEMTMPFLETYISIFGAVLEGVQNSLKTEGEILSAIEILNQVGLITFTNNYVPPVTPPPSGGFPIIPPVLPPTEPGNPENPVGTPNPDVIYTSLAMREATQLINFPSVTPAQVTPVLEALAKEVLSGSQDIVETQQIVERAVALFEKLLENPVLTNADAIAMVEMVLSQFVAPAMVKDSIGATDPALKVIAADLMTALLEKVGTIPSSGVITLAMAQTAAKAQDDALAAMKETLNAIFSSLEQSRLTQNLMITAPATSVRVEADGVAFMKANDLGLTVKSGSAMIILPTALVDGLTSSLSLMVDLSPKSSAGLGLKLQNGNASSAPVVYDISLYLINAQNEVAEVLTNIQPLVSLPIGNLTANLHTVGAYYYNETSQVWEYVRSTISGNRMVFLAPHLSTYGVLQRSMVFSDMMTHWAKNVVEELAVKNIISGRAPELYVPNGTITRAEFATLLVQTLQLEGDIKVTFADVDIKDWYYQYVNVAALHGLVSGVGDGKFNPNANITRQDMAIMIVKAYEKMLGTPVKSVAVDIKDLSDVSQYAKDRVLAARFNRLIGGYPDGTFKPLANATRAEAAQMIRNLLEK
jgi:hypothetical protein